jgi:hypothetical protein
MGLYGSLVNSEVSSKQREEMIENMILEVSSYQQGQLIEKADHKSIMMIGGINIFLPSS